MGQEVRSPIGGISLTLLILTLAGAQAGVVMTLLGYEDGMLVTIYSTGFSVFVLYAIVSAALDRRRDAAKTRRGASRPAVR